MAASGGAAFGALAAAAARCCSCCHHAAGRGSSATQISMEGIVLVLETAMDKVRTLLDHVVPRIDAAKAS